MANESKIGKRMYKFFALKMFRKIVPAWRQIKETNNLKRINIFKIREKLSSNPELGRPLLVLKNFLLFKAFNQLCEGATIVYDEAQMVHQANTQYYLNRIRKTFLCLKLNTQLNAQEEGV